MTHRDERSPARVGWCAAWLVFWLVLPGPCVQAEAPASSDSGAPVLEIDGVLLSLDAHFPLVLAAREQIGVAEGELQAARGGFDTTLFLDGTAETLGFYQNEQVKLGFKQILPSTGIELSGGYKLGQGEFAVWDKDLETNSGGEFRVGAAVPLARDRAIDKRRAELWKARLERRRVDPQIDKLVLVTRRDAALSYWRWVAAGENLDIAAHLLELAENRQSTMEAAVEEGLLPRIDLADNERLIAERRAFRVQAERGLEKAAIALSLYLRDLAGNPLQPSAEQLPETFPLLPEDGDAAVEESVRIALRQRPELEDLTLKQEQIEISARRARNDRLPQLDLRVNASQDRGTDTSGIEDKDEFELAAGVMFSLPVQRRAARGELQQRLAELKQVEQRLRLQRDRIALEVRDAVSARVRARERMVEAERSVVLAQELEEAERFQLREGNSDLLRLNIRERQAAEAAAFLVNVTREYFEAWTLYQVVMGNAIDPGRLIPPAPGA